MNLVEQAKSAIVRADQLQSKLTPAALCVPGMSSPKVRHFLNNVTDFPGCRYLEIGTFKGSTLIAALLGKRITYWAIDNFVEYGGTWEALLENYNQFFPGNPHLIGQDCFSFDPFAAGIKDVNVYFYDGWHSQEAQEKALTHYIKCLKNPFIFIVDDWNGKEGQPVRDGTMNAIQKLKLNVLYDYTAPGVGSDVTQWWNGLWIAVLQQTS